MYYSKTTNGFYPKPFFAIYKKAGTLPNDLVEITQEYYQELLGGQSDGKMITADATGKPILVDYAEFAESIQ